VNEGVAEQVREQLADAAAVAVYVLGKLNRRLNSAVGIGRLQFGSDLFEHRT
jgi:hypothetical protein